MIKHKKIIVELDKQIDVFDGLFPLKFREHAFEMFEKSLYRIGWADSLEPEKRKYDQFLHSVYDETDYNNLGILKYMNECPQVVELLEGLSFKKGYVNVSNPSDVNYVHSHFEAKVVLYYGNLSWVEGGHGETNFYSEDLSEVQFTSPYTPGRLIIFDGKVPHCLRPQSIVGPKYRFTFASIWH